jgi:hypothetical protein
MSQQKIYFLVDSRFIICRHKPNYVQGVLLPIYQVFSLIYRFCEVMPDIAQQLAITGQIYLNINMVISCAHYQNLLVILCMRCANLNQSSQKTT